MARKAAIVGLALAASFPAYSDESDATQTAIDAGRKLRRMEWLEKVCGVASPRDAVVETMRAMLTNTTWGYHGYEIERQQLTALKSQHGTDVVCDALKSGK